MSLFAESLGDKNDYQRKLTTSEEIDHKHGPAIRRSKYHYFHLF